MTVSKHIAIVGAGMAAIACARTLVQAGHRVTLLEKSHSVGGRMATRDSAFGSFDHGAQYFTVRDQRFARALQTTPEVCKPWSANTIRVLDAQGRVATVDKPASESHWVPKPNMRSLLQRWAEPIAAHIEFNTKVTAIAPDTIHPGQWQLHTTGAQDSTHVFFGFDAVVLAIPSPQAQALLQTCAAAQSLLAALTPVTVAPCWTLMLAFPQAVQPGLTTLGPQWNAARSTHHRIAWLARESSKPGRTMVERWTVQASPEWSDEHVQDDPARVEGKLLKAFSEITGIRAEPAYMEAHLWRYAKTMQSLGEPHLWDAKAGLGVCGDWCLGNRVEDAFLSGLEMALTIA